MHSVDPFLTYLLMATHRSHIAQSKVNLTLFTSKPLNSRSISSVSSLVLTSRSSKLSSMTLTNSALATWSLFLTVS